MKNLKTTPHQNNPLSALRNLVATICFSPFTCASFFLGVHSRDCSETEMLNSHNHSYVHYSLPLSSRANGSLIAPITFKYFTPIARIVATKLRAKVSTSLQLIAIVHFSCRFREGISFPNFEERSIPELPSWNPCAVLFPLQNGALFKGEKVC